MAYWDGEKIVYFPPEESTEYPGWEIIDCGCCNGIEWGEEYPKECRSCGGSGVLYRHKKSGTLALYPGGPFAGKSEKQPIAQNYKSILYGNDKKSR
ncbi:MAG: hypothetical protein ACOC5T_05130 [Elusimicrobiota bacterium]